MITPPRSAPVVVSHQLSVHYGQHIALRDVDLVVRPGERVALVGRNGAGKSTLLSALAGAVEWHGDLTWSLPPEQVAVVPQRAHPRWDMPLDVSQVVLSGRLRGRAWWRRPSVHDRRRAEIALDRLGLSALAHRPVRTLSGGQAQRTLLARALAQEPRALLLDEPYDGLDQANVAALNVVMADLAADGVCVIAAVHDLATARDAFDRVVALDRRIIADGPPSQVFTPSGIIELFGMGSAA